MPLCKLSREAFALCFIFIDAIIFLSWFLLALNAEALHKRLCSSGRAHTARYTSSAAARNSVNNDTVSAVKSRARHSSRRGAETYSSHVHELQQLVYRVGAQELRSWRPVHTTMVVLPSLRCQSTPSARKSEAVAIGLVLSPAAAPG